MTTTSNQDLIGREGVNDLDAILAMTNTDIDSAVHAITDNAEAIFTWDYEKGARPGLNKLYEKAKTAQWNGETDLPWDTDVDLEQVAKLLLPSFGPDQMDVANTPLATWGDAEWLQLGMESQVWALSQFMHGEQGALLCTAKIVETVPWIDAKYYAATQVMDEARHVEVFAKYLDTKLEGYYPINTHLGMLLDDIVADARWDMTYLGMQIMVEGLALAAFGFMRQLTNDPLLAQLLRYVMSDEARHVAFGTLSLGDVYTEMSASEIRERQEFAFEAGLRMRDRGYPYIVWERLGLDSRAQLKWWMDSVPNSASGLLFSKIVPNIKKLGLLDAGDGWLRRKYEEIDVMQFEDWTDSVTEYDALDGVAEDRLSEDGLPGDRDTETAGR